MIWLKRLLPFVILAIIGFSVHFWRKHKMDERTALETRYADVAAQVWVASTTYRENPDRIREFRDSILAANDITVQQMYDFLIKHRDRPEEIDLFAYRIQAGVDSLVSIQDSLRKIAKDSLKADSARAADSLKK